MDTMRHRRTQGGTSAAVQVRAGQQSSAHLTAVLDCVAKGGSATMCVSKVSPAARNVRSGSISKFKVPTSSPSAAVPSASQQNVGTQLSENRE